MGARNPAVDQQGRSPDRVPTPRVTSVPGLCATWISAVLSIPVDRHTAASCAWVRRADSWHWSQNP